MEVHITYKKDHPEDCAHLEDKGAKIDIFDREIKLTGELNDSQQKRLLEIANICPVHKTLHAEVLVRTKLGR